MADRQRSLIPDISGWRVRSRWAILIVLAFLCVGVLKSLAMPAYLLLGAMAAGVAVSIAGGGLKIPMPIFFSAQTMVGCLIARSITLDTMTEVSVHWPIYVFLVLSVTAIGSVMGWYMAKKQILPGSTAVWGTSPGAALLMTIMSEGYGGDSRLVALMQYSRLIMVTLAAVAVAQIWGADVVPVTAQGEALVTLFDWLGFGQTLAVAACGLFIGLYLRFPSGPMLFPMLVGSFLNCTGIINIELPWWLLAGSYMVVGTGIGLRFSRQIVLYSVKVLPSIMMSVVVMIAVCCVFALGFSYFSGIDPLTSYLATSPGGIDAVAIVAVSTNSDVSFIMAVHFTRLILVVLIGPWLATTIVKRLGYTTGK